MENKLLLIILGGIALAGFIILILARNRKDKKELEEKIKEDYKKPREHDENKI